MMLKPALQRVVLRTSAGPLGGFYRELYRAPAWLARRWLPDDVADVSPIRPPDSPGFVVGMSDIDLLAIVRSTQGDVHVSTVAAIAKVNRRLRALFPFFQHCFSVTSRELSLPAADHWLGMHSEAFRMRLPASPGRVPFARCLSLQHACRWFCRGATMPALFGRLPYGTIVNHQRRSYRILRELAYGMDLVGEEIHDEDSFAAWQRGVSAAAGLPLENASNVATSSAWFASAEGALAIWRFMRDAARCWGRSAMQLPTGLGAADVRPPSGVRPVADALRALNVRVVAGASGERETDDEAYLLVDDDAEIESGTVLALARGWQQCRAIIPGVDRVSPLLLTPSLLRWIIAVCPWRAAVLRERRDDDARRFAEESWPWERHARLATMFWACRDFREDVQGTPDEIASLARFTLPRLLLEVTDGEAPAGTAAVHERFVDRFGPKAWGYGALRSASFRLERTVARLDERVRFFAAGLPLADAASERLVAMAHALSAPASLPSLSRSTPLLESLRRQCVS